MKFFATAVCFAACAFAQNRPTEEVDLIWSARYVVGSAAIVDNGAIAIKGERIVAVGPRAQIDARYRSANRIDQTDAILAPGLVNTHTHAAMSLFRGVANDRKLQDWLENAIFPAEAKNVDREFVRWGTRLALYEMALSGTTTFTDMYYFEDTVAEETRAAGLRGVLGAVCNRFPSARL
jgi:5-methylthioadenosine/S-adenosylhomocysteine deaminase